MEEQDFEFYIDRKESVWRRESISVRAETKEEALAKARDYFNGEINDGSVDTIDIEVLYETFEPMSTFENDGRSTAELLEVGGYGAGDLLMDNIGTYNISSKLKPVIKERVTFAKDT